MALEVVWSRKKSYFQKELLSKFVILSRSWDMPVCSSEHWKTSTVLVGSYFGEEYILKAEDELYTLNQNSFGRMPLLIVPHTVLSGVSSLPIHGFLIFLKLPQDSSWTVVLFNEMFGLCGQLNLFLDNLIVLFSQVIFLAGVSPKILGND